jgi:hypothetical protein
MVVIAAILIGLISNWSVIGRAVVGCSWINTGGIKRREVEEEVVAEVVAEAAAEAVVEVAAEAAAGCRRSAKDRWDRPFLFSYIYRVRKAVKKKGKKY